MSEAGGYYVESNQDFELFISDVLEGLAKEQYLEDEFMDFISEGASDARN